MHIASFQLHPSAVQGNLTEADTKSKLLATHASSKESLPCAEVAKDLLE